MIVRVTATAEVPSHVADHDACYAVARTIKAELAGWDVDATTDGDGGMDIDFTFEATSMSAAVSALSGFEADGDTDDSGEFEIALASYDVS